MVLKFTKRIHSGDAHYYFLTKGYYLEKLKAVVFMGLLLLAPISYADEVPLAHSETAQSNETSNSSSEKLKSNPWLIAPLVSSDPKLSTAVGALAGYVRQFDEKSPPSLFGIVGTYSTTDSWYLGLFGKVHFGEDKHRLSSGVATGEVRNDYEDYLGSGFNVKTTDDISILALRYAYGFYGRWYLGSQFISTNYAITGDDAFSGAILDYVGLTGFRSNGLGLYTQYDSRDNQYSPLSGQAFEAQNTAFRKGLGGDESFDTLSADYRYFVPFRQKHVLGLHAKGRWTNDAPPSGYSSIDLRGYTRGQYLASQMIMGEADYRHMVYKTWLGAAFFCGVAALYGDNSSDKDYKFYPAGGAGLFYVLNDEKMVVRADFSMGTEGNYGFYLQLGHPF